MTDTATAPSTRPKPKLNKRQHKARRAYMKVYMRAFYARRRAKFLEALAMLEKLGDDDVIEIIGKDYPGDV